MRETPWTETHENVLRGAAPGVRETSEADHERIWHRVENEIGQEREPRRHRARVAVGAVVAALVLGTSAVAAADLYSAHTGRGPIDAEDRRLGGPGERLDPAASDYGQVVAEQTADIPFPDAASRGLAVQDQVDDAQGAGVQPGSDNVSVGAVRAWVADAAVCAWSNRWAAATRVGDGPDRAEAIRVILQAPSWPAVTAIDPDPSTRVISHDVTDEWGRTRTEQYRDDSQFFYLRALGRAARGLDLDAVAVLLAENNGYCRPALVPDLPQANPMFSGG